MQTELNEIEINGVSYVRKETQPQLSNDNVVLVRTRSAGVFFGYKTSPDEDLKYGRINLINARRIWYWAGAASLSQLAVDGTSKPEECKFPVAVPSIQLTEVIEVIPCTTKAVLSLTGVKIWRQ